jgi:dihydropteroate synthase
MAASLEDILASHRTHRPIVMGIVNVTPDSFSDGGRFLDAGDAVGQAQRLAAEGADVIDLGAESTRPGSARVPPGEQIDRLREVLPAMAAGAGTGGGAIVSIDTTSAAVARFALEAGARIVNDISAGRDDAGMFGLVAERGAAMVLMHMQGQPGNMQADPQYGDVVGEVRAFLTERLAAAEAAGVPRGRLIVDPGIGFGKRKEHNLALLAGVGALAGLGVPVLVGPSRKRFLGELTGQADPQARGAGTLAACLAAWSRGATIFRVHDVGPLREALAVAAAIEGAGGRGP